MKQIGWTIIKLIIISIRPRSSCLWGGNCYPWSDVHMDRDTVDKAPGKLTLHCAALNYCLS
jgi:hypothetical protein